MVPTATVLLGGRPVSNTAQSSASMTIPFRPPANVSGRCCYLNVTNVVVDSGDTPIPTFGSYYITMDLTQPMSYASVNNAVTLNPVSPAFVCQDSPNQVVAVISAGQGDIDGNNWATIHGTQPRILVDIPEGPQYITITIYKSSGTFDDISHLGIFCEITPIDYGLRPDIDI